MAAASKIEWTEATWNPVTGCTKISPGCAHCYAERMAKRLKAMGQPNYRNGFEVTLHERMLGAPLSWNKPQVVFVNSMSDLFHSKVPAGFIQRVFAVMRAASWHRFQVLTKRAGRMAQMAAGFPWPDNLWMGVTIESDRFVDRADKLRNAWARARSEMRAWPPAWRIPAGRW